jgi:3D (Asp-Asp-Asp) domain-containing protein
MQDEMKWYHGVVAIVICCVVIFLGTQRGKELNQIEAVQAGQKIDSQEKEFWDKEIVKMRKDIEEWKTVKMNVSAYCPCEICCNGWSKIPISSGERKTASGHTIKIGDKFVAAPKNYPFGTEMIIKGYANNQVVKVLDRGGAIKDNKLDIYFDTHQKALNFGRKDILVKVRIK